MQHMSRFSHLRSSLVVLIEVDETDTPGDPHMTSFFKKLLNAYFDSVARYPHPMMWMV